MDSNSTPKTTDILGYRILEKIGAGGYGEVWKAIAPGGLLKAIKILYGFHDEKRAQIELKSLERVKQLRHPFLLSLERIDVVDGQLVVITELADRSLADLFDECTQKGLPGIPRDELLRYLSQAAEALDYLSTDHTLQHLDVKPENFLLIGQHAKLADFGLVKDLKNISQSLLGGMTPTYAAPEMFDGRPTTNSDQYSLAIVYQEMLTGERPFSGSSAAQLAAQHMHGKPNLRGLPTNDQPVIAKALSKDPSKRYRSCTEMIGELLHRKTLVKSARKQIAPARKGSDSGQRSRSIKHSEITIDPTTRTLGKGAPISYCSAPEINDQAVSFTPILVIGVGRLATQAVAVFKQRVEQQIGSLKDLPAIGLLAIDSDRTQLLEACSGAAARLTHSETLNLSLRRPEDYRERSRVHTGWLNRRWIYNVPKSLQTEGLRPLGRLAFVDHFSSVWDRLNDILDRIATPEAMAKTLEHLEVDHHELQPRVVIVSSISGGIGSGSTLDLAYAAKMMLIERGFSPHNVQAVLLHGIDSRTADVGVAAANSFAFLTELRQYVRDGYPGESTCGLPEMPGEAPFDHTYLIELGTDASKAELEDKISQVGDYLFLNNLTPCAKFFERCRELEADNENFTFRSFGVSAMGLGFTGELDQLVGHFVNSIMTRWIGTDDHRSDNENADDTWQSAILTEAQIEEVAETAIAKILPTEKLQSTVVDAIRNFGATNGSWKQPFQAYFGLLNQDSNQPPTEPLVNANLIADSIAEDTNRIIGGVFHQLFRNSQLNLGAVGRLCSSVEEFVTGRRQSVNEQLAHIEREVAEFETKFDSVVAKQKEKIALDNDQIHRMLSVYAEIRISQAASRAAADYYRQVLRKTDELKTELERLRLKLKATTNSFKSRYDISSLSTKSNGRDADMFLQALLTNSREIVSKVELRLFHETVEPRGSFWEILQDSSCLQAQLIPALIESTMTEVVEAGKSINLDHLGATSGSNFSNESLWDTVGEQMIASCQPLTNDCGGNGRALVAVPRNCDPTTPKEWAERALSVPVATLNLTSGDLVMAVEVDNISLADFALELMRTRSDCLELAQRLHARADVRWTSLQDLL